MPKLTDMQIRAWIKADERFEGRADGNGLYLRFRPADRSPSWRFRYKFSGKSRSMVIASHSELSLSKAREMAKELSARVIALVERMETAAAALIGGKQGIPPHPYNEDAVLQVVVDTIKQGFDNGRVIAQRINDAGYQTRAGKAWDKDIYSAWKRQKDTATKIAALLEDN